MRHTEYAEYAEAVAALEPVLDARDGKVIAIGGWPNAGKTTLGRYLAWQFNVSLVETDLFIVPNQGTIVYREDEIARVIDMRIGGKYANPVIVEGSTVLRVLANTKVTPDFSIYVARPSNHDVHGLTAELENYEREYRPRAAANLFLELPAEDQTSLVQSDPAELASLPKAYARQTIAPAAFQQRTRPTSSVPQSYSQNSIAMSVCIDGDLGLTTLRGGFGAASFHLSYAHRQAYICTSSSLAMVPDLHPMALRAR